MLQLIKFFAVISVIFLFILLSSIINIFVVHSKYLRLKIISILMSQISYIVLKIMGFKIHLDGNLNTGRNCLIVSNHLSYIDILIFSSLFKSLFVTSVEMKNTPFLGFVTRLGGCLYVERRSRANLKNEILELTNALLQGFNIGIFPEATSTNGEMVLPFKSPLYTSSIDSGTDIKPVCINYASINGVPVSIKNRDFLFWYGEMGFLPHLWELMKLKTVKVHIKAFEEITPSADVKAKYLAVHTQNLIAEQYDPIF